MSSYIDPRLRKIIHVAGESGRVEAIIVAREDNLSSSTEEDGELMLKVIENTIEYIHESPISVRFFPRANAAVISASGRFIQAILQNQDLAVASTTEIDAITFLFP